MGCRKSRSFVQGAEIYLSRYNLFLQFLHYRRKNNRLKMVVSILSCGAFERSKNPYIESNVEPCVSKNQKEISLCGFDWEEYPKNRGEAMEKSIHELRAEFLYLIL